MIPILLSLWVLTILVGLLAFMHAMKTAPLEPDYHKKPGDL